MMDNTLPLLFVIALAAPLLALVVFSMKAGFDQWGHASFLEEDEPHG